MLIVPHPSSSPSPTPLPAKRHVYSWLKPPSLTLSQIGTQSDGERRDGARLSCFIQFHYSVWGGVSVLTLLCQHSGRGSCAVIWLKSVTESQQCRVCQLIRCCQRTFRVCDFSFWSSIKRQLNTFHGRLSVFWAELAKQLKSFFWCTSSNTFFSYFLLMKYVPFHSSSYRAEKMHKQARGQQYQCELLKWDTGREGVGREGGRENEGGEWKREEERGERDEESVKLQTVKWSGPSPGMMTQGWWHS